VLPHVPPLQTSPAPHFVPQAPQFCGSSFVSAQIEPQSFVPPPQLVPHLPCEQSSPLGHAVPHAPQFALSFCVLTQLPLQRVPALPHALVDTSLVASVPPPSVWPLSSPPQPAENAAASATAAAKDAAQAPTFKLAPM
jgi:hypothetical protein